MNRREADAEFLHRLGLPETITAKLRTATRAYVLGMGPSLNKFDLTAFGDELIFGVNHAAATGTRHDLLFLADDRRLVPELRAGNVPIITIDACVDRNPQFFADTTFYGDIKAVHYAEKIPAILDVTEYPRGLPVAYWTGSVITDLVIPFTIECGISELICLGLDGLDGSFPQTHAWGTDVLTRRLLTESASSDAEALPTDATVAHLQEKVTQLARRHGTEVVNATPGGYTEVFARADPRTSCPPGAWRTTNPATAVDGSHIAIGTSVFQLRETAGHDVELIHLVDVSDRASNRYLHATVCHPETAFIGNPHICLAKAGSTRYLTTRTGFDRFTWREPTQPFNTTLSSFPLCKEQAAAENYATLIGELAGAHDQRAATGDRLASMYGDHRG